MLLEVVEWGVDESQLQSQRTDSRLALEVKSAIVCLMLLEQITQVLTQGREFNLTLVPCRDCFVCLASLSDSMHTRLLISVRGSLNYAPPSSHSLYSSTDSGKQDHGFCFRRTRIADRRTTGFLELESYSKAFKGYLKGYPILYKGLDT